MPCLNGASCTPKGEDFQCDCLNGFTGRRCEIKTTFNFQKKGHWIIPNSGELESIDLGFRTNVDGLLFVLTSTAVSKLAIYIHDGKIVLKQDSHTGTYQTVRKLSATNDQWHQLHVTFSGSQVLIVLDQHNEQTYNNYNLIDFNSIIVGGNDNQTAPNYAGCMQDLTINHEILLESDGTHTGVSFGDCAKTDQCSGNPCNGRGICVDEWVSLKCNCFRQYFGERCQFGTYFFEFYFFQKKKADFSLIKA